MIEIKTEKIKHHTRVTVPGSKSYSHRYLIAAALSDGLCTLDNCLYSEDTLLTRDALKAFGIRIIDLEGGLSVQGTGGKLSAASEGLELGNSGTSMRLITAVAALAKGRTLLSGSARMHERPIQDLLDGLNQLGVTAETVNHDGCPPVVIRGDDFPGGPVRLNCSTSSQYLSALLLVAPYARNGLDIEVLQGPVSKPYVDMTLEIMERFGVNVEREGYNRFRIKGGQVYRSGSYRVEPDASQAGYFWAAAAVTGNSVRVKGLSGDSKQGDVRFAEILGKMGCSVSRKNDGIEVSGGTLSAVEVDMADLPDMVPTLAVVAAFAEGTTVIKNVAHLKAKESDRLGAVARELSKMGIAAKCSDTDLTIRGGDLHGAEIDTYDDHRIAMSFAVAGLKTSGVFIREENCVRKSFPEFWEVFNSLYD